MILPATDSPKQRRERADAARADLFSTRRDAQGQARAAWSLWEDFRAQREALGAMDPDFEAHLAKVDLWIQRLESFGPRLLALEQEGVDELGELLAKIEAGQRAIQAALVALLKQVKAKVEAG